MQQSMLQAGIMRGQFGGNMMMQPNGMQMNNEMAKRVQQNTRNAYVFLLSMDPRGHESDM